MKINTKSVRHKALKVKQLVEKDSYNELAATNNLKCNEIVTRVQPNKLKDFAQKRQVKHPFAALEHSIPFHTLLRHVYKEDFTK